MSGTQTATTTTATSNTLDALVGRTLSNGASGSSNGRAGATRFPFKAKSAYFPSAHTEFQAAIAGASAPSAPLQSETAREKRHSQIASPPRHHSRPKSLSNPFSPDGSGKEKQIIEGNGPFEPSRTFGDKFIDEKIPTWTAEKERILLGPFDYLYGHPGKDIRSQLIAAFNVWLKVPDSSLAIITKVVGMLHTASLL
jgi:geranylgeranyl diphosphate synthase type 3